MQDTEIKDETFENLHFVVTPAKAGVQKVLKGLDTAPVFTGVTRRYDIIAGFM